LYYLEYKNEEGWQRVNLGDDETYVFGVYETYAGLYKFVMVKKDTVTTTTEVVRDSSVA